MDRETLEIIIAVSCNIIMFINGIIIGRKSATRILNKQLDERVATSKKFIQSQLDGLEEITNELKEYNNYLEKKDRTIRKRYQDTIVDIARYEFANKNGGKWSQLDDQYFRSWNSAEPKD